jgi:hypothetical protein
MRGFLVKTAWLTGALALVVTAFFASPAHAQRAAMITFYTGANEDGSSWRSDRSVSNTTGYDSIGPIRSIVITSGTWRLCKEVNYTGFCVTLGPGAYSDFDRDQFADRIASVQLIPSGTYVYRNGANYYLDANGNYVRVPYGVGGDYYDSAILLARVTLFAGTNFTGRSFDLNNTRSNLFNDNFNDMAQSMIIRAGRWQICEDADFGGRCMILGRGEYADLNDLQMGGMISSVRPI